MKTYLLSAYLQRFFTERLGAQMKASPNTIASYRDTFRLLLRYAADLRKKEPTALLIADIDADLVAHFLTDLEKTRGNGARSRNTRLAAIRSFFKYVAVNEPQLLHHCQRVLAMPAKRHEKRAIDYLDRDEIEAVIAAPDLSTWHGRRDRAILLLTLQTGLRVTELITLTCDDIALGSGAHVRCMGKGRKERATPIRKDSIKLLRDWLAERKGKAEDPLFADEWDEVIDNYLTGGNDRDRIRQIDADAREVAVTEPENRPEQPAEQPREAPATSPRPLPAPPVVSPPPPRPQTVEEKFASRKKVFAREIPVTGDSIELRFYDNAEIDGDSISLFLNDRLIFEHIRLTEKAYVIKLAVKDLQASNELTMVAENLGSIPPNTSYMVVMVGNLRYDAQLQSTEGSSALVRFVKKE